MTPDEYPALYRSADDLSTDRQRSFLIAVRWQLLFLVLSTTLSAVESSVQVAFVQAVLLIGSLSLSVYLLSVRPDRHWYGARAVAESIKTATWRFVSRAEPFNHSVFQDRDRFITLLAAIVDQNRDVAKGLSRHLDGEQLTHAMVRRRDAPLEERMAAYSKERITEQLEWYAAKASWNRRRATGYFVALVVANACAVAFAIARLRFVQTAFWPTDSLAAAAIALLAWLQTKRFSELAGSYALAAHEISLVREQLHRVSAEEDFARFVGDAENAFSREHTQWVARKDE